MGNQDWICIDIETIMTLLFIRNNNSGKPKLKSEDCFTVAAKLRIDSNLRHPYFRLYPKILM
jgi:hypothetical protein